MNRNVSVYLDLMRLVAALGVFLGHVRHLMMPGMPAIIGGQAGECVAIFFVLSGFVISFVTDGKERDWKAYSKARAFRMYSVVTIALLVTFAADQIGLSGNAAFYANLPKIDIPFNPYPSISEIFSYLTFTNEVWFQSVVIGTNQPYWSIGFEVSYYLLFGILVFTPKPARIWAFLVAAIFVGPKIVLFFPLWLIGVAAHRIVRRPILPTLRTRLAGLALFVGSGIAYLIVRFALSHHVTAIFVFEEPKQVAISWLYFHLIGLTVAANIIGFAFLTSSLEVWPASIARSIRWLAGASFSLYLMHLPILLAILALFPQVRQTGPGIIAIAAILAIILLLAEVGERRKRQMENLLSRFRGRLASAPRAQT